MPYLQRARRRPRSQNNGRKELLKFYNTKRWDRLRTNKRMDNPVCEVCLHKDKTTATQEIHHIKPLSSVYTDFEREALAYDPDNLISLCIPCHNDMHTLIKKDSEAYWKLMKKIS